MHSTHGLASFPPVTFPLSTILVESFSDIRWKIFLEGVWYFSLFFVDAQKGFIWTDRGVFSLMFVNSKGVCLRTFRFLNIFSEMTQHSSHSWHEAYETHMEISHHYALLNMSEMLETCNFIIDSEIFFYLRQEVNNSTTFQVVLFFIVVIAG